MSALAFRVTATAKDSECLQVMSNYSVLVVYYY